MIGKQIEVLNKKGEIIKTITIAKIKKNSEGDIAAVIDSEGDIYLEEELNWVYKLTPEAIIWESLNKNNIEIDWNFELFHNIFKDIITQLINSNYISENGKESNV